MTKYLVTGASGLIGSALVRRLLQDPDATVCACSRKPGALPNDRLIHAAWPTTDGDRAALLDGIDIVMHCAAMTPSRGSNDIAELQRVNCDATVDLARQAAKSGADRFLFVSSAQVHGSATKDAPLTEESPFNPQTPYAQSKWQAERGLLALAAETGLSVTIVRPPLVYGRGAKGNLTRLANLAALGLPLPLGGIGNQRSLIALDNLIDFLALSAGHPAAAGEVFLVSDGHDLSTGDIIRHIAADSGKRLRLFRLPVALLRSVLSSIGRAGDAERLFGSFRIDSSKACTLLGWDPVVTPDTVSWV